MALFKSALFGLFSSKNIGMCKIWILPFAIFNFYIKSVNCKRCLYEYESGLVKEFYCSAYEFCCGLLCCRPRSIGFFQLWYFWLLIMIMLLLCSGGGWWVRYRRHYRMEPPHFGYPTAIPAPAPPPRNMGPVMNLQSQPPPPYMAGNNANSRLQYPTHVILPAQMQNSASSVAQVSYPLPTYLGPPPPSYAIATGQATS